MANEQAAELSLLQIADAIELSACNVPVKEIASRLREIAWIHRETASLLLACENADEVAELRDVVAMMTRQHESYRRTIASRNRHINKLRSQLNRAEKSLHPKPPNGIVGISRECRESEWLINPGHLPEGERREPWYPEPFNGHTYTYPDGAHISKQEEGGFCVWTPKQMLTDLSNRLLLFGSLRDAAQALHNLKCGPWHPKPSQKQQDCVPFTWGSYGLVTKVPPGTMVRTNPGTILKASGGVTYSPGRVEDRQKKLSEDQEISVLAVNDCTVANCVQSYLSGELDWGQAMRNAVVMLCDKVRRLHNDWIGNLQNMPPKNRDESVDCGSPEMHELVRQGLADPVTGKLVPCVPRTSDEADPVEHIACPQCDKHDDIEGFDVIGACSGNVFCTGCHCEFNPATGKIHQCSKTADEAAMLAAQGVDCDEPEFGLPLSGVESTESVAVKLDPESLFDAINQDERSEPDAYHCVPSPDGLLKVCCVFAAILACGALVALVIALT